MADRKRIVVLSGSGISAESGLSTFRGGNGLWDNVPVEEVCSAQAWRYHPEKVQEFFNVRRAQLKDVEPNEAHRILARMERDFDVEVVTQNVDNLHERAGSTRVLHLHGELTKVRPEDCCCERDGFSTEYVMDIGYRRVEYGETGGPRKTRLRPHIVFFGEAVPNLEAAAALVAKADVLLIVGTSMQVYPAASLYRFAPSGCGIYVIDPEPSAAASIRGVHIIRDKATSGMKRFLEMLTQGD
ncbi:MAG: SIR2 family NAD-dependent protein deacylase [Candidatus Cryptobacteroides sp.]